METVRKIDASVINLDTGDAMYNVECELTFSDVPKFDGSIFMSAERYNMNMYQYNIYLYVLYMQHFSMADLFQF